MPAVTLYGILASPFCRPPLMVAKALGVDVELIKTSPMEGDHLKPEYLELNPRHTIPTLDDEGFVLSESRAIMCYLVDKYGEEDDALLPKDPQQRGLVLERMLFDSGCLSPRLFDYFSREWMMGGELDEKKLPPLMEAVGFLDKYLEDKAWAAGENMTLADFGLAVTVSQLEMNGIDLEPYSNVTRWLEACKSDLPGFDDINEEGHKMLMAFFNK